MLALFLAFLFAAVSETRQSTAVAVATTMLGPRGSASASGSFSCATWRTTAGCY